MSRTVLRFALYVRILAYVRVGFGFGFGFGLCFGRCTVVRDLDA